MHKSQAMNLIDLPAARVKEWLQTFDTVLTDCDGTLWQDDHALSDSPAVIHALQSLGKQVFFITNNGLKTRYETWKHATNLGFTIEENKIIAPTYTIVEYLKRRNFQKQVYIIGNAAIARELSNANIESFGTGPDTLNKDVRDFITQDLPQIDATKIGAVIVGWDEHFSYVKMMRAHHILTSNKEAHFLATNLDTKHKYPNFCLPGTGAFVVPIEASSRRKAVDMGKPNPVICEELMASGALKPERALMIGDCCKVDVSFGRTLGMQTLLVGTGSYQYPLTDVDPALIPDYYLPKLGDLLAYL